MITVVWNVKGWVNSQRQTVTSQEEADRLIEELNQDQDVYGVKSDDSTSLPLQEDRQGRRYIDSRLTY